MPFGNFLSRMHELVLSNSDKKHFAIVELEKLLSLWEKRLKHFSEMPNPEESSMSLIGNMLLGEELVYDKESLKTAHESLVTQLTAKQMNVYDSVMNDIDFNGGGLFFVYDYEGTGKTFVWRTLSAKIRNRSNIVMNVASSGKTSLFLPGGSTTHSKFAILFS
ncbi:PREDICTED: uncharacterized protein LOC109151219 [Ipomoea nil]|uniref:uncharacterized protein LOC109151219 n=1 Tax=Ipomoea nil TaxID=35883 RepID=UPI000900DE7F|nr:PREDICTED: uncharacterized protein LOC109151219 [Ipomoea nil]